MRCCKNIHNPGYAQFCFYGSGCKIGSLGFGECSPNMQRAFMIINALLAVFLFFTCHKCALICGRNPHCFVLSFFLLCICVCTLYYSRGASFPIAYAAVFGLLLYMKNCNTFCVAALFQIACHKLHIQ